jgi:Biotin/lipoate A/B protein ligase family
LARLWRHDPHGADGRLRLGTACAHDRTGNQGFGDAGSDRWLESFARHFMRVIDYWREAGFAAIADNYACRLERTQGVRRDIGDRGELLLRRTGRPVEPHRLGSQLAVPSWLDPHSGKPRV